MTKTLTLEERVTHLDQRILEEEKAWEREYGGTVRGKPAYGTVDALRRIVRLWHGTKADDDEFLHKYLDKCEVPRTVD